MEKITTELKNQEQYLKYLANEIFVIENRIIKITGRLDKFHRDLEELEELFAGTDLGDSKSPGCPSNIIPFTTSNVFEPKNSRISATFLATPGKQLPPDIPDCRSILQRDGLILLGWDKRMTQMGARYTAYWVTSAGIARFYASKPLAAADFYSARPDRKSYAAEDGIEFYGQEAPVYIVHVAPELMMSNPRHAELRRTHINTLKIMGSKVDFDYKYLLKTDKNRSLPPKTREGNKQLTGA